MRFSLLRLQVTNATENEFFVLHDFSVTIFLGYQILGLIFIIIYMLLVLVSNIYLVSLINLNLNSRLRKMWDFLNRKTYKMGANVGMVILIEVIFLIISYLMVSGTALDLLNNQVIR